jgi:hypothetical protein
MIRLGWPRVAALLLLPRAAGALRASAPTSITALHHVGGGLHPLLRDVHGDAAISASVPVVPRVAPSEQAAISPRWLLLLAPDEGLFQVHHRPEPWQVGALEGGLGAGANRRPLAVDATNRCADGPPCRLGAGPRLEVSFQPDPGDDLDPGRERV